MRLNHPGDLPPSLPPARQLPAIPSSISVVQQEDEQMRVALELSQKAQYDEEQRRKEEEEELNKIIELSLTEN